MRLRWLPMPANAAASRMRRSDINLCGFMLVLVSCNVGQESHLCHRA